MTAPTECRGRFAPSPTGPLHFGSLVAAIASFLQARSQGGEWFVRIEDLDPPREQQGAADEILYTLEALGLTWDGPVWRQSARHVAYEAALGRLRELGAIYACRCSRREISDSSVHGIDGPIYPGTCRNRPADNNAKHSLRVRTDATTVSFDDRWQGRIDRDLAGDYGDFIVRRADGLFAYQLAVVVDDAAQGITEVVRGVDLLESTPRQIHLQRLLRLPTPSFAHHAVVVNDDGQKLSKQTQAKPIDARRDGIAVLKRALEFLGQPVGWVRDCDRQDFWRVAAQQWRSDRLAVDAMPAGTGPREPAA